MRRRTRTPDETDVHKRNSTVHFKRRALERLGLVLTRDDCRRITEQCSRYVHYSRSVVKDAISGSNRETLWLELPLVVGAFSALVWVLYNKKLGKVVTLLPLGSEPGVRFGTAPWVGTGEGVRDGA